jgi:hypothetical protein
MLENCLQAFESFVLRAPKEIGQHVEGIVAIATKFIKYDPNYADDEDDEDEDMGQVGPPRCSAVFVLLSSHRLDMLARAGRRGGGGVQRRRRLRR